MDLDLLRQSYDRFADTYDQVFGTLQRPKIRALWAAIPRPLSRRPWVDLGSGTGLVSRTLRRRFVSLDAARRMLERGPGPRVQASLDALPFPDFAIGLAISVTALIDRADPRQPVREMARVLRPGGVLALSLLKRDDVEAARDALREHFAIHRQLDLGQDVGFICEKLDP